MFQCSWKIGYGYAEWLIKSFIETIRVSVGFFNSSLQSCLCLWCDCGSYLQGKKQALPQKPQGHLLERDSVNIEKRLLLFFQHLEFTELQIEIWDQIGLFTGHAFVEMKSMSCQAFQSKKLAAASGFRFNVSTSCVICNDKGVNGFDLPSPINVFYG